MSCSILISIEPIGHFTTWVLCSLIDEIMGGKVLEFKSEKDDVVKSTPPVYKYFKTVPVLSDLVVDLGTTSTREWGRGIIHLL
eukprot:COSAG02_NODE_173_length_31245_cov_413.548096_6_plen_83_part_00